MRHWAIDYRPLRHASGWHDAAGPRRQAAHRRRDSRAGPAGSALVAGFATGRIAVPVVDIKLAASTVGKVAAAAPIIVGHAARPQAVGYLSEWSAAAAASAGIEQTGRQQRHPKGASKHGHPCLNSRSRRFETPGCNRPVWAYRPQQPPESRKSLRLLPLPFSCRDCRGPASSAACAVAAASHGHPAGLYSTASSRVVVQFRPRGTRRGCDFFDSPIGKPAAWR